jgi:SWIM zinc finger
MSPATTKTTTRRPKTSTPRPAAPAKPSKVRRLKDGLWWVESSRHPGQGHKVRVYRRAFYGTEEVTLTCTCPAATYGRSDCRHRVLVRGIEAWRQEQLRLSAPVQQLAQRAAPTPVAQVALPTVGQAQELAPLYRYFE